MSDSGQIRDEELFDFFVQETKQPFSGWNFAHIEVTRRMVEAPLSWSYASIVLAQLKNAQSVLDMGTGGGEFLSSLQPLPALICATEKYAPNVPLARQRLEPLGVKVYGVDEDARLPFSDGQFDLVINRHESYAPQEVLRILKPGGQFITQQVGGKNLSGLNAFLGAQPCRFEHWRLDYAAQELRDASWQIVEQKEEQPVTRFFDVGALIYCLKAVPWQVEDFAVEKYFDRLVEMHKRIQRDGYFDVHYHRFLIVAQKL
jgi:SAM-dependent methyltransferase